MNIYEIYKQKIYPNLDYWYHSLNSIRYRKFALRLPENFLSAENFHPQRIMRITKGEYSYEYFNFCYLHNILSLMLYAVYHHAYPLVCINESEKDLIQWDWYFHQPQIDLSKLHTLPSVDCAHATVSFQPHFKDIYDPIFIRLWGNLYANFVHLNDTTKQYIETEYQTLFSGKKRVLGVICRGTDYVTLHPPGHPVQPSVDDVIAHCKKLLKTDTYDAIYLATEEKQIRDTFCQAFPNMILENKRRYYDDIYYKNQNIQYIKDVQFDRENNNYWTGLEYLSSIILLSRCSALVGGNCGGTMAALFFNNCQYQYTYIFDLGLYP
ncbi:hypothetical protein NDGK_00843 [Clostridiales bacterium CHKCI001]|nr:hypothetical protein NDGK_00843 [Clostridiales bacterium CHKCI001]